MNKIEVITADFNAHFSEIEHIRTSVFINEQKVPVELEWDEFDSEATHILAYYEGSAVGTARLLNNGHIGRMAVLVGYRSRKIGQNMLKYLIQLAENKAVVLIKLSAQEHAVKFYQKYGFNVTSNVYMDAGIPHYDMEKSKGKVKMS